MKSEQLQISSAEDAVCPEKTGQVYEFSNSNITEASGIFRSMKTPCVWWVHNDSGDMARLFAVDAMGRNVGEMYIKGNQAVDWEDMSGVVWQGKPWLIIADMGDNFYKRDNYSLYVVPEPDISSSKLPFRLSAEAKKVSGLFPEGQKHNIEAMAADSESNELILVAKEDRKDPAIFSAPLSKLFSDNSIEFSFVGRVKGLGNNNYGDTEVNLSLKGTYFSYMKGDMVTSMDISHDKSIIAILTYKQICLWQRQVGQSWTDTLKEAPVKCISAPADGMVQMEAISFNADGQWLFVGDEADDVSRMSTIKRDTVK